MKNKEKLINVILYCRTNTDEKTVKGFSLNNQKETLKKYCEDKKYNIIKHYEDVCSGISFDRPEWNNLMDYVKNNKNSIDIILISDWSRLSRKIEKVIADVNKLSEIGIAVNSIKQPLDITTKEYKLMLSIYLTVGNEFYKKTDALHYQINNINK
jgi:site-specific DNA recombinase